MPRASVIRSHQRSCVLGTQGLWDKWPPLVIVVPGGLQPNCNRQHSQPVADARCDLDISIVSSTAAIPGTIIIDVSSIDELPVVVTAQLIRIGERLSHPVASGVPLAVPTGQSRRSSLTVAPGLTSGPYGLAFSFDWLEPEGKSQTTHSNELLPVWLSDDGMYPTDVVASVNEAFRAQARYVGTPIRARNYTGEEAFRVFVLLEGCQLDYQQPIEGGTISPLPFGVSCESQIAVVNRFCGSPTFSMEAAGASYFQARHPLTLVTYSNVLATDEEEAKRAIDDRVETLSGILAMVRSASSRPIAFLVQRIDNNATRMILPSDEYRGNLVPGILPGQVTEDLALHVRAARKDPWLTLAVNMFNDTLGERNALFQVVKLWAVLEACAKRRDFDPPKAPGNKKYVVASEVVNSADLARKLENGIDVLERRIIATILRRSQYRRA